MVNSALKPLLELCVFSQSILMGEKKCASIQHQKYGIFDSIGISL